MIEKNPRLKEILELTRENNRLLRKMYRNAVIGNILRVLWLTVIIGVPVYLYLTFLQPYIQDLSEAYEGVQTQLQELQEIPEGIKGFLEKLQSSQN